PVGNVKKPNKAPLGIYKSYSHSGKKMGILRSAKADDANSVIINDILKCFLVDNKESYKIRENELRQLSESEQAGDATYCMLVIRVRDEEGNQIGQDDYDLYLLAGNAYKPESLPTGFFMDRQMNAKSGCLVYYLNAEKMSEIKDGKFGLRVVARPTSGFSYYCAAEYRSDGIAAQSILASNETTYLDIILHRFVDKNVFRFDSATDGAKNFKHIKPSGEFVSND
ncbi:MAG: hypothetical protein KAI17_25440, partial [Thiotrichaceae bacterium]|nr:hypothetical protein [Thiotrichaceae bacterium]